MESRLPRSIFWWSSNTMCLHTCLVLYLWTLITVCHGQGCFYSSRGKEYAGSLATTVSGKTCRPWSRVSLGADILDVSNFPDMTLEDAGNYCRNPTNDKNGPWCVVGDSVNERETCGLHQCDCKQTYSGEEYTGKVNVTKSGVKCPKWTKNFPQAHTHHGDDIFPDGSEEAAQNYCRNVDRTGGPWCYTTKIGLRWEYCNVPACACIKDQQGMTFVGDIFQTKSGITCQKWISQSPHKHDFFMGLSNSCRNPDGDPGGPWCYTTDPNVRKESCDVPYCFFRKLPAPVFNGDPATCAFSRRFNSYSGRIGHTSSGRTCQRWDSQTPHVHIYKDHSRFPDVSLKDAANYCRNPDESVAGPWCYTTDPGRQREACRIKYCECKVTRDGIEYLGRISRTQGGNTCQRWDAQIPHIHTMTNPEMFPDGSLSEAQNYCRNPDRKVKGPWCFTLSKIYRWDFCRIPICPKQTVYKRGPETTLVSTVMETAENTIWISSISQAMVTHVSQTGETMTDDKTTTSFTVYKLPRHAKSKGTQESAYELETMIAGVVFFCALVSLICFIVWMVKKKGRYQMGRVGVFGL